MYEKGRKKIRKEKSYDRSLTIQSKDRTEKEIRM